MVWRSSVAGTLNPKTFKVTVQAFQVSCLGLAGKRCRLVVQNVVAAFAVSSIFSFTRRLRESLSWR